MNSLGIIKLICVLFLFSGYSAAVAQSDHRIFNCVYDKEGDIPMKVTECFAEKVSSGERFVIADGNLSNFEAGICKFKVPRGSAEDEVGLWKMALKAANKNYITHDFMGTAYVGRDFTKEKACKFRLKGNSTAAKEALVQRTKTKIIVRTTKPLETIECAKNVFYPIRVCYLMAPAGPVLSDDKEKFEDGNCEFKVAPGTWTCGFNGPEMEDADFTQEFEVIQYPTEAIDGKMTPDESGSISLECHHIKKLPIQMCMFVAPTGKIYRPPTDHFQSEEFSFYAGGKMSTGDCGIQFKNGFELKSGNWQCIIATANGERLTTNINVV